MAGGGVVSVSIGSPVLAPPLLLSVTHLLSLAVSLVSCNLDPALAFPVTIHQLPLRGATSPAQRALYTRGAQRHLLPSDEGMPGTGQMAWSPATHKVWSADHVQGLSWEPTEHVEPQTPVRATGPEPRCATSSLAHLDGCTLESERPWHEIEVYYKAGL